MNIRIEEKLILEALFENDRPLSTTELKSSTGIDRDAIGYSVREKLEPAGLVSYEYDDQHGTEVRVHELTQKANSEIQQGLIGDVFAEDAGDTERVALEARIDELEDEIAEVKNKTTANKQLLDTLGGRIDSVAEYVEKHQERVNALRMALEEEFSVDVVKYVKQLRKSE